MNESDTELRVKDITYGEFRVKTGSNKEENNDNYNAIPVIFQISQK